LKQFKNIFWLLTAVLLLGSCSYRNSNILFKTPKEIKGNNAIIIYQGNTSSDSAYRHRIKAGDRIVIRFLNTFDIGTAANQSATAGAGAGAVGDDSYLINYDSTVVLPLIGRVNLCGLTRLEAAKKLEKEYSKFIVNPIIDLNISTLNVTILGEVNFQGKITIDKENTTLVDIIAKAGGFKESGKKHSIRIIRGKEVISVDLRKIEALQSPSIIMHDNDIVYVEPYRLKANSEPVVTVQPMLGMVTTILQTALFVVNVYIIYASK